MWCGCATSCTAGSGYALFQIAQGLGALARSLGAARVMRRLPFIPIQVTTMRGMGGLVGALGLTPQLEPDLVIRAGFGPAVVVQGRALACSCR